MHIYFSGIGGTGIGPLALIAKQAGYTVSGSDKQDSQYIDYLRDQGIANIHIGQTAEHIATAHNQNSIDWFVHSSAVSKDNPELLFCHDQSIKTSKRDELLTQIIADKNLKLIAVAGTHGKTTTTAMVIWLFKQLKLPVSYSVGAKIPFGDMGHFDASSTYFVYECDEFDRNFLAFEPAVSLIPGVSWDHHEIFPTREDYQSAFKEFISQSKKTYLWQDDADYLTLSTTDISLRILDPATAHGVKIKGFYNRLNAWLAITTVHDATGVPTEDLSNHMAAFPGLQRRMEQLIPNLYTDYAHTPEKIKGGMSVALEIAQEKNQDVVVVYEPLTNRRQHYMLRDYKDTFSGVKTVYWLPSYLAREDPNQRIIPPEELISHLNDPSIAQAVARDAKLKQTIEKHLDNGDMVVCMNGGGGDSLDEWLRANFVPKTR